MLTQERISAAGMVCLNTGQEICRLMFTKLSLTVLLICGGLNAQVAIVNNASFRADQPVAGGSWVAACGACSGVATTTADSLSLPETLPGVKLPLGRADAP